ncbi:NAD(P)-dependent dehydrogenase (short-subunit alcohol dehydrogenase family) [Caballeronia udeis]|uniref:NAD(P)-dependent dehydrogenase (Short-subunit alcohol dehydrogenase family) n=1 Tax=Caballeronia udeis TaxID=1232866 RepID=A0ABW8MIP6_9BURK
MKGKSALVTGSSNGLGLAMVEGLARLGCNVVLHWLAG